jgi:hypothetical protein
MRANNDSQHLKTKDHLREPQVDGIVILSVPSRIREDSAALKQNPSPGY